MFTQQQIESHPTLEVVPPTTVSWRRVLFCLLLVKVVYLGVVYLALSFWPDLDEQKYFEVMRHWPLEGKPESASHFGTWDGAHYLYLSTRGYTTGTNSCAFYPLWPLVISGTSHLTGGSPLVAGMLLANMLSLAAWTIFYQITARRFGKTVARLALVSLIVFPGSLFYQFIYSEPLFFLLMMLLWLGLEQKRYGLAWIAAFLLPLSRAIGLFCVLPIGWHWLMRQPCGWLDRWKFVEAERRRLASARPSDAVGIAWPATALLAAPALGWVVYLGLMWMWTGNPFEGFDAQKYWGTHSISHLWNVPRFVGGFFSPTAWHSYSGSVLDRCAFMLLVYCVPLVWRLGKDMIVWAYVLGVLPAMSGTFTSFTRFESAVFPLFIALAVFFTGLKRRWPLAVFMAISIVLHGILLWRFVNFRWAG